MTSVRLVIVEGPNLGREFQLAGTMAIGRDATVGIVLDDAEVSRRHSLVTPDGERAIVKDLGSRNGTIVNGEQVTEARRVSPGDRITIGETVLELRSAEDERAGPRSPLATGSEIAHS